MTSSEHLAKIEAYCSAFYGGSSEDQVQAHKVLLPLINNPSYILQLQMILANSQVPSALLFAACALHKLFTKNWNRITDQQKDDTRKFLLNYLYNTGPALLRTSPVLLYDLVRLLCRIIKLGWLENLSYQNVTEQVRQFLQASTLHFCLGLIIYKILTEDMQPQGGTRIARFRRTAISFRETALGDILQTGVQTLQQLNNNTLPYESPEECRMLLKQALQLTLNCLSFNFGGCVTDESNDEQATVMIPHTWQCLREEGIPAMFFSLYHRSWRNTPPREDCAQLCLQCLVLLAAIRRSFFQKEEEKRSHTTQLIEGTASIIQMKIGLQNDDCYHELCRLLGRINTSHQLSELSQSTVFIFWLETVFQLTIQSLEYWNHLPNSKHYLVSVWANLVAPATYLREKAPQNLIPCIQKVTMAYIDSRMKIAEAVGAEIEKEKDIDFEDPLTDEVMRAEQLEVLGSLGRCGYPKVCRRIIELLETAQNDIMTNRISSVVFQQKAAWLIYMISTLLNVQTEQRTEITLLAIDTLAPLMPNRYEENEDESERPLKITEDLASIVFCLMKETDKHSDTTLQLELSYLYFLEHFRKLLISEHAKQIMQIQSSDPSLTVMGHSDPEDVLNLMIEKFFFNFEARVNYEPVIKRTMQIFSDSVVGLSVVHAPTRIPQFIVCGKLILKSHLIREALNDHRNPKFAFLSVPAYGRYRTDYYATLTKLLLLDNKDEFAQGPWNTFMEPFADTFQILFSPVNYSDPATKLLVVNLARDLRGVIMAATSVDSYAMFFDWMVNKPKVPDGSRIDCLVKAIEYYWAEYEIVIPLLKLMIEFGWNKSQRITFGTNSPNGIFLFKVLSKVLHEYGSRIISYLPVKDIYKEKYKGVAACLEIAANTLSGGYTNFGVFKVYDYSVLKDTISLCLQLCIAIPDEDLQAYIKAFKSYYNFLDLATSYFMDLIISLESNALAHVLRTLEDGLCSFENAIAQQSYSTIGSIVQFIFTHKGDVSTEEGAAANRFLNEQPQVLRRILHLMLQLLMTGEVASAWSMTSPLLGLILLDEEGYIQIKEQLIMQQIAERRDTLRGYFNDLMVGIDQSLSTTNKENFSKNLHVFSQLMRSFFA